MKNAGLKDLLVTKVKSLYDIEKQVMKSLPKMAKNATNPSLKAGFRNHLAQTRGQIKRLEQVFKLLGVEPSATKVEAIRGLSKDADWVMKNIRPKEALDANLVAAAQYVEHFEMAGYGTASEWASQLGEPQVVLLLNENLKEEEETDELLSGMAKSEINPAVQS